MHTRREVLKGLIVSLGGASLLTACGGVASVVSTSAGATTRFYTPREMELVARLSDLIIPRTETPGALDVNVPGYMDGLMSEWASSDTRQAHRRALEIIDERLSDTVGGDFVQASESDAEVALIALDSAAFNGDSSLQGYRTCKSYITQCYFATEPGAVQELKWVAVPGRWDPSVEIR